MAAGPSRSLKDVSVRVRECAEIRSGIQGMGMLVDPAVRQKLRDACNAFVTLGRDCDLRVRSPMAPGFVALVRLRAAPGVDSGALVELAEARRG